jgi:serine/threonine-protein kinase RsbW
MSAHTPGPKPHVDFNSDCLDVRLDLRFSANLDKLPDMVDTIMRVVTTMECAKGHEPGIELSLHEAMANAIRHGAGNDSAKMIQVKVACEAEHGMLIVVSDPGDGFDPKGIANPLQADNLFSDHGRGIFLINRLMDEVEFKRNGTEIHMRKFKTPADGSGQP